MSFAPASSSALVQVSTAADVAAIPAATARSGEYVFGKTHTLGVITLLTLLMSFDFADRMIVAALLPAIRVDWHIGDAEAGLLSSVLYLGMVLFILPASLLIDRWRRLKMASLMGIFWSISSAAGLLTRNFSQLLLTRAGVGIGEAGYAPASYAWIVAAFPVRRRLLALGLFTAGQPIGMAFGVALGGFLVQKVGWHHALGLMALPGFLIAVLLWRGRDYANREAGPATDETNRSAISGLRTIFTTPSLMLTFFASAMATLQWDPIFYFLPTFLHRVHGIPVATASYMTSGIILFAMISIPLGGWLMDRIGVGRPAAKLTFCAIAVLLATALFAAAFGIVRDCAVQYGLIFLATLIVGSISAAPIGVSQELAPPHWRALSGSCLVIVLHFLGSMPGPFLTGLISDRAGITAALFAVSTICGILALLGFISARRRYTHDLARAKPASVAAV